MISASCLRRSGFRSVIGCGNRRAWPDGRDSCAPL